MEYKNEIFDRKSGELIEVSLGDWITFKELGELFGFGRNETSSVLRKMNFLQIEGTGKDTRHRLANWVLDRGWGKRNKRKTDKYPFDVVGPDGLAWIEANWDETVAKMEDERFGAVNEAAAALEYFKTTKRRKEMSIQACVNWYCDHLPSLTQEQIAAALHVSQQLVSRFIAIRKAQLTRAKEKRARAYTDDKPMGSLMSPRPYTVEYNTAKNDQAKTATQFHAPVPPSLSTPHKVALGQEAHL